MGRRKQVSKWRIEATVSLLPLSVHRANLSRSNMLWQQWQQVHRQWELKLQMASSSQPRRNRSPFFMMSRACTKWSPSQSTLVWSTVGWDQTTEYLFGELASWHSNTFWFIRSQSLQDSLCRELP